MMAIQIKIVAAPQGPNPLWVREAWIGLYLPVLEGHHQPQRYFVLPDRAGYQAVGWKGYVFSLLCWLTGQMRVTEGYPVPSARAIEILAISRADAALWWKENAPTMLRAGMVFIFDLPSCERDEQEGV
jgi:hypothetical protein